MVAAGGNAIGPERHVISEGYRLVMWQTLYLQKWGFTIHLFNYELKVYVSETKIRKLEKMISLKVVAAYSIRVWGVNIV